MVPVSISTMRTSLSGNGRPTPPGLRTVVSGLAVTMFEVSDIPYPSVITAPDSSSKVRMASRGSGADPETTPFTDPTFEALISGCWLSPMIMVGTAGKRFGSC